MIRDGDVTINMTLDVAEFDRIVEELDLKLKEAARQDYCYEPCKCGNYYCGFLKDDPHPIHAFPEHGCRG